MGGQSDELSTIENNNWKNMLTVKLSIVQHKHHNLGTFDDLL